LCSLCAWFIEQYFAGHPQKGIAKKRKVNDKGSKARVPAQHMYKSGDSGVVTNVFFLLTKQVYQPSLTNPRDALHHGKRAANKGGRSV